MNYLLDTHILLWAAYHPGRLSEQAVNILSDESNSLIFSAVNIWEIVIKTELKREDFKVNVPVLRRALKDNGYTEIAMTSQHCFALVGLEVLHKDPFDRMLISQAISEGVILLTADSAVSQYDAPIQRV